MGVDSFHIRAAGPTLQAAFEEARNTAAREHGTSPYAGTVYNKTEIELFDEPARTEREASLRASELLRIHHLATSSPAGALPLTVDGATSAWLLFGYVVI
ncbi:hypothetical protein ACH41H_25285 [Streptomyces sp. NPDC020800]|uniref:hypothetical protein n=1 Tax=Streptomyces sp. NPDC020800 TaxID=3365092 RepID=UPI0037B49BBD